ncbi:MAG TPA: hypothetical protein VFS97_00300 [Nitrososphaeraceae archaeon]|nr:hypothetical protein [Nitrososphaeraceae archaeon]
MLEGIETRLQPKLPNIWYQFIMDLATNRVVISDALKYVERKAEAIDTYRR